MSLLVKQLVDLAVGLAELFFISIWLVVIIVTFRAAGVIVVVVVATVTIIVIICVQDVLFLALGDSVAAHASSSLESALAFRFLFWEDDFLLLDFPLDLELDEGLLDLSLSF